MSKAREELSTTDKWWIWIADPVIIAVLALLPFTFAFVLVNGRFDRLLPAIDQLASVLTPILDGFYAPVGVIVAVLVTMAVATSFGAVRVHPSNERMRVTVLSGAAVGVFTVAFMAAMTIPVGVAHGRWFEVAMALVTAWVVMLSGHLVGFTVPLKQKLISIERAYDERVTRAQRHGMSFDSPGRDRSVNEFTRRVWFSSEVALWLIPGAAWVVVALLAIVASGLQPEVWLMVLLISVLASYGPIVATLGWRATADVSLSTRFRCVVRGAVGFFGLSASAALACAFLLAGLPALAAALMLFTAAHVAILGRDLWRRRWMPWTTFIERMATTRGLNRALLARNDARSRAKERKRQRRKRARRKAKKRTIRNDRSREKRQTEGTGELRKDRDA
ncbi:hypothetical protein [Microbacterium istanbulense]|uniref:Uncharacterized protein n=1 Tax=Microbacterium istanbulense TaxID=3122049 RepID=A0ABU8LGL0_9MICO